MIYNPNELPFWEVARGSGPITKQEATRKKRLLEKKLNLVEVELAQSKASYRQREIERLEEKQAFLVEELGEPS